MLHIFMCVQPCTNYVCIFNQLINCKIVKLYNIVAVDQCMLRTRKKLAQQLHECSIGTAKLHILMCRQKHLVSTIVLWSSQTRTVYLRNRKDVRCFYWVKHVETEWKFGRMRNAVGTRAAGECFHSFFEFFQTFTSVSIKHYSSPLNFLQFLLV